MTDALAADTDAATEPDAASFQALDDALDASGPGAALDLLIGRLAERSEFRSLLDALLLKARHELGLPLLHVKSLGDLPEPARTHYEERYVEAIRSVGSKLLARGELAGAWTYFRVLGETAPVTDAIEAYEPGEDDAELGSIVEVAFNHGAHPRKGFELILKHYGTCSAITAFEHLPTDEAIRTACAEALVRQLHEQLVANLRAEIAQRGQPMPPEGTPVAGLLAGRDWLLADEAYHIDVSHLMATVRVAPLLADPDAIARAVELTDYGRNLSERHRYEGEPPFERVYEDHGLFLRALLGKGVDEAIAHFRAKVPARDPDGREAAIEAQVLVNLLVRLGRIEAAIDLAAEHVADFPETSLVCPGVAQLCQRAGRPDRLAEIARARGDLVNYAAARLQAANPA